VVRIPEDEEWDEKVKGESRQTSRKWLGLGRPLPKLKNLAKNQVRVGEWEEKTMILTERQDSGSKDDEEAHSDHPFNAGTRTRRLCRVTGSPLRVDLANLTFFF
jgi:hypothetical protein